MAIDAKFLGGDELSDVDLADVDSLGGKVLEVLKAGQGKAIALKRWFVG